MDSDYIIVNATALDKGGALTILKQFVENIPGDADRQWLIFIPDSISLDSPSKNIRLEPIVGIKPMHKRLWWDTFGIIRWLKRNNVNPIGAISLQNTGFRVGKCVPSFIYYHQSIPFSPFSWSPFKRAERTFWFYKSIYPLFVRLFLTNNTHVYVQLEYIKEEFTKKFNHPADKIEVYLPNTIMPATHKNESTSDSLQLFYPAMGHFYKNHKVIVKALRYIDRDIEVSFTTAAPENQQHDKRINYLGELPFEKVCEMYSTSDALLFPSCIETFGLPLIEAAMTGIPIIAADLPFAREVLKNYEGATFVGFDDAKGWAAAINRLEKSRRVNPINLNNKPGWKKLFQSLLQKI